MMGKRVVISGLGVVSPTGTGLVAFTKALKAGKSGIKHIPELESLGFASQIGGIPDIHHSPFKDFIDNHNLGDAGFYTKYALIAALEAWRDAGLCLPEYNDKYPDMDTGIVLGSGVGALDLTATKTIPFVNAGNIKQLRSTIVEYMMFSGPAAILSGIFSLGNRIITNSSACASSCESVIMAYELIKSGKARRMLAGGAEVYSPYAWAGFDAMRVSARTFNNRPDEASRPMSASAKGFVPAAGAAFLVLEDMALASEREADIYAEICGGAINAGGQKNGGSTTAMNPHMAKECIKTALREAGLKASDISLVAGHLTSTGGDPIEIKCWADALGLYGTDFPYVNALKSMTGHLIGAAGAIETLAACLQIKHNFIHPSINCDDIHPEILKTIDASKIPSVLRDKKEVNAVLKAGFGFGDVNACLVLKKFDKNYSLK